MMPPCQTKMKISHPDNRVGERQPGFSLKSPLTSPVRRGAVGDRAAQGWSDGQMMLTALYSCRMTASRVPCARNTGVCHVSRSTCYARYSCLGR